MATNLFGGVFHKLGIYQIPKWKFIRGDTVKIISGRDKGNTGIIKSVNRKNNNVIVEGLKLISKRTKATKTQKPQQYTKEAPIHYSNIAHIDPKYNVACRVRFQLVDGVRERVSRISNTIIQKPPLDRYNKWKKVPYQDGLLDTPVDIVKKKTYSGIIDSIDPRATV